ncbi:hypothetical protein JCM10213_001979 [Rhodosporidiobolus nylandii]
MPVLSAPLPALLITPPTPLPRARAVPHSPLPRAFSRGRPLRRIPRVPPPPLSPTLLELALDELAKEQAEGERPCSALEELLELYAARPVASDVGAVTAGGRLRREPASPGRARSAKKEELPFSALVPLPPSPTAPAPPIPKGRFVVEVRPEASKGIKHKQETEKKASTTQLVWDAKKRCEKVREVKAVDERLGEVLDGWGF